MKKFVRRAVTFFLAIVGAAAVYFALCVGAVSLSLWICLRIVAIGDPELLSGKFWQLFLVFCFGGALFGVLVDRVILSLRDR